MAKDSAAVKEVQQPDGKENFPVAPAASTEVAPIASSRLQYAGAGFEGVTQDSFAIPFITVLQKSSPQVDEDSGQAIPGAKAGMIYNTVTGKMYDGKKGVVLVPCAQRRVFLRWKPRGLEGGGFRGEFSPEDIAEMKASGEIIEVENRLYAKSPDGSPPNDKRNDRFADTRNHYVLVVDEDGGYSQALLSLTSTQIRKSKALLAMLDAVKRPNGKGQMVRPATFDNLVRMTTVPESNDQGNWHGVKFELIGPVPMDRDDLFEAALTFNQLVQKDNVTDKYDENAADDGAANGNDGKF